MIKFKKLHELAKIPARATAGSAGFDLYAIEHCIIWPFAQVKIATGIATAIPDGYAGFVWPRSGMAVKHGINKHAGLIDSDYRGEIHVCLINHGDKMVEIYPGDRIAQLVVSAVMTDAIEVDGLDDTERGVGGFGSTGA